MTLEVLASIEAAAAEGAIGLHERTRMCFVLASNIDFDHWLMWICWQLELLTFTSDLDRAGIVTVPAFAALIRVSEAVGGSSLRRVVRLPTSANSTTSRRKVRSLHLDVEIAIFFGLIEVFLEWTRRIHQLEVAKSGG